MSQSVLFYKENPQALVELGDHLSKSKVKAEELRYNVDMTKENKWVADKETVSCQQCNKNFSVSRRRVRNENTFYRSLVFFE